MTSAAEQPDRRPEWRNRPGRDLLVALGVCYAALVLYGLWQSGNVAALGVAGLLMVMASVGIGMSIMKASMLSLVGIGAIVVFAVALAIRLKWYVRIPLLIALFGAAGYSAALSGIFIS